jgi:diguanylate cyclase (GGDEF)-like protein
VVDTAAKITRVERASLRLLDPTGSRLFAVARAGEPLHFDASYEFRRDEGLIGWIVTHGQTIRSDDPTGDPRFAHRGDQRATMGSFLGVPIVSGQVCIGVLSAVADAPGHFDGADEGHLMLLAAMAAPHIEMSRVTRLARIDPLTGALNRHGLEDDPAPRRDPLSVLFVDVDKLEGLNERHGHAAGDEVLRAVTRVLAGLLRREDAVVRWGGEELVLLLPAVDLTTAARVAERARAAIESTDVGAAAPGARITVSIGVAERRSDEELASAIDRAARAMVEAKEAGRNRVSLAS